MITNIEITVYNEHGESVCIPLSPLQAKTVFKVLMISPNSDDTLTMASDITLSSLWHMKGNPLKLQEDYNND